MFRLWGKIFKDNHMLADYVAEDSSALNRTKKVFNGLEKICNEFDLGVPMWLDKNVAEFKRVKKTRFTADCFIEAVDFDYLEIHVIEEDDVFFA